MSSLIYPRFISSFDFLHAWAQVYTLFQANWHITSPRKHSLLWNVWIFCCLEEKSLPVLIGSRPLLVRPRGCSAVAGTENDSCSATVCYHGDMLISKWWESQRSTGSIKSGEPKGNKMGNMDREKWEGDVVGQWQIRCSRMVGSQQRRKRL